MDAADWDDRYRTSELVWSAGPNQFVEALASAWPPGRAIDVACGEGRNAIWLAEHGWDAVGVDFSAVAIDKARRAADERGVTVSFEVVDVASFGADPIPDQPRFDLVLVAYLQLPSGQLDPVLSAVAGMVAPGGHLLVVGHHVDNLERGYGGPSSRDVLHDPVRLARTAEAAGLVVTTADDVLRTVMTPNGPRDAVDALVVARRDPR
ncbi:MAG: class I SAM-dependent methyltransferase [Acidimicrobiales bacterium]